MRDSSPVWNRDAKEEPLSHCQSPNKVKSSSGTLRRAIDNKKGKSFDTFESPSKLGKESTSSGLRKSPNSKIMLDDYFVEDEKPRKSPIRNSKRPTRSKSVSRRESRDRLSSRDHTEDEERRHRKSHSMDDFPHAPIVTPRRSKSSEDLFAGINKSSPRRGSRRTRSAELTPDDLYSPRGGTMSQPRTSPRDKRSNLERQFSQTFVMQSPASTPSSTRRKSVAEEFCESFMPSPLTTPQSSRRSGPSHRSPKESSPQAEIPFLDNSWFTSASDMEAGSDQEYDTEFSEDEEELDSPTAKSRSTQNRAPKYKRRLSMRHRPTSTVSRGRSLRVNQHSNRSQRTIERSVTPVDKNRRRHAPKEENGRVRRSSLLSKDDAEITDSECEPPDMLLEQNPSTLNVKPGSLMEDLMLIMDGKKKMPDAHALELCDYEEKEDHESSPHAGKARRNTHRPHHQHSRESRRHNHRPTTSSRARSRARSRSIERQYL